MPKWKKNLKIAFGNFGNFICDLFPVVSFKSPNDLLINKKKVSGILQEIIVKDNKKYLIVGIGINIIKSPKISKYPTTNLLEILNKKIDYKEMVNQLKLIFEKSFANYFKMKA